MFNRITVTRAKNGFQLEVEGDEKVEGAEEMKWYCDNYVFPNEAKLLKALKILVNEKGE